MAANSQKRTRLDPTLFDRIRGLLRGGRGARMLFLRRAAATALVLLAAVLALQPRPGQAVDKVPVLVASRDLPPGHVLARVDVVERPIPVDLVPNGVFRDPAAVEGRVLATASRVGEPLTDVRLAGPALTRLATGGDTHASVPIRLADPGVADFLYPGRKVDIVSTAPDSGHTSILAERAPVIALRPPDNRSDRGRLIVVGLPEHQAAAVAAASLAQSVTVTLR